ncbi:MAG: hypothetical protein DIU71_07695 [Proteobacteria bacterium]|nr:MAG: hypothetical protein DIU71_07695 [Pseudomonadota bacterium]
MLVRAGARRACLVRAAAATRQSMRRAAEATAPKQPMGRCSVHDDSHADGFRAVQHARIAFPGGQLSTSANFWASAVVQRCAHATTARKRVHRPQSSLRFGHPLYQSGRGRFFSMGQLRLSSRSRPVVVIIEADAADRRSLCALLSSLDVEVRVYESAESYLAERGGAPRCLVSDVALPGMSGLELLKHLRAADKRLPVILIGEDSDVPAAVAAMQEGAADFIEKPHADVAVPRRVAQLLKDGGVDVRH